MKCPARGKDLSTRTTSGITVDVCDRGCGGIWFDNVELQKVDEAHESAGEPLLDLGLHNPVSIDRAAKRVCPRCPNQVLRCHYFTVRKQVEIDECPACGGIWLDAGELAAIRSEFKTEQER
jgi:Zn-finger nucleic acid-binding protein